jgi:glyoxylase-like metal-dependent hydrolase (beta-lactamase superfamily II)
MMINGYELLAISDGALRTALDNIIGLDRPVLDALVPGQENGTVLIPVNNFVLRGHGRTMLIDAGSGHDMQPTLGKLPANLRAAGIDPAEISHILLTHVHPDHTNGLVDAAGAAHFPAAEILVSQIEADFWLRPADRVEAAPVARNRARAVGSFAPYLSRLRRVADGETWFGCTALLSPGHTPGHTGWRIGDAMVAWGDTVHLSAVQISHPEAALTFDLDPDMARASRRRMLEMVASEHLLVAGAHVAAPGLGHVERHGDGFAFVPLA